MARKSEINEVTIFLKPTIYLDTKKEENSIIHRINKM